MIDDEPDYEDRYQQQMEREEIDPRLAARADDLGPKIDEVAFAEHMHREYRKANRPFRSAFRGGMVAGERGRKILASVGHAALKAKQTES